jgi:hypothetical protein
VDTHLFRQVQPKGGSGKLGPFDFAMSIETLPRPVLLGIIGVVAVGGLLFMTKRSSSTSSSVPASPPAAETTATPQSNPSTPATPESNTGPAGRGLPAPVKRALDAHKVVAVLFWNPRAIDDRSVHASLEAVPRRGGKVAVFSDRVKNLSRYTRISTATSINTTPSLVVVNRKGEAEVVTGYLDRQTVAQYVRNALRR